MKFEIRRRFTAKVLFECEAESLKIAVEKAVEAKINLRGAYLVGANLRGANLHGADLGTIKEDFYKILDTAKPEVTGLYDALMRGKINGSTYSGECACLVGTIANVRKVDVATLEQNASRPAERWFLGIRRGDVPSSNQISDITREWIEEFAKANEISLPTYRLVSSLEIPEVFK